MVEVTAKYVNIKGKRGSDYFIYTDVEVIGHATNTGYDTNIKVCAGISAVTYGIARLLNQMQYNVEYRKGYYHLWTNIRHDMKSSLDRDSVYAVNTMVCQLYEIYKNYPNAFAKFDLIDTKELIEDEEKSSQPNKPFRRRNKMGFTSLT